MGGHVLEIGEHEMNVGQRERNGLHARILLQHGDAHLAQRHAARVNHSEKTNRSTCSRVRCTEGENTPTTGSPTRVRSATFPRKHTHSQQDARLQCVRGTSLMPSASSVKCTPSMELYVHWQCIRVHRMRSCVSVHISHNTTAAAAAAATRSTLQSRVLVLHVASEARLRGLHHLATRCTARGQSAAADAPPSRGSRKQ